MMFTVAIPFVNWVQILREKAPLLLDGRSQKAVSFHMLLTISFAMLAGFVTALVFHAHMRGDTIMQGMQAIWNEDVLRRTFGGNVEAFSSNCLDSLLATPLETISKYVFQWTTSVIAGLPDLKFPLLFLLSLGGLLLIECKEKRLSEVGLLYVFFMFTALSWLVLGKSHSYVHTHINFVVLYFGCIQVWCYCILRALWNLTSGIRERFELSKLYTYRVQLAAGLVAISLVLTGSVLSISFSRVTHSASLMKMVQEEGHLIYADSMEAAYYINGNVFIMEEKGSDLIGDTYYIRVTPVEVEHLPIENQADGYIQYVFAAGGRQLDMPFWFKYDVERREFANYPIKSIEVGKFRNKQLCWKGVYEAEGDSPPYVRPLLPNVLLGE